MCRDLAYKLARREERTDAKRKVRELFKFQPTQEQIEGWLADPKKLAQVRAMVLQGVK